jgi:hypothetical protein
MTRRDKKLGNSLLPRNLPKAFRKQIETVMPRLPLTEMQTTKSLIEAHKKAVSRSAAALKAIHDFTLPNNVSVIIAEIGPNCVAYDQQSLSKAAGAHSTNMDIRGLDLVSFNQRIAKYRQALQILLDLREQWLLDIGWEKANEEYNAADDEVGKLYRALLARIKHHRRDVPAIARYFATQESSPDGFWRPREVLQAIAKADGKAARL